MTVTPIPDDHAVLPAPGTAQISVMLIVPDAPSAAAWYRRALGAETDWDLGSVVCLQVGGAPFLLHEVNEANPAETSPDRAGITSTRIELFVDDPEAAVRRAVSFGATPGSAVESREAPWGRHLQGGFRDPFGHNWSVGDKSPISRHTVGSPR